MTAKRFTLEEFGLNFIVNDNGKNLTAKQTVDRLNTLHEENIQLKNELQFHNCVGKSAQILTRSDWEDLE